MFNSVFLTFPHSPLEKASCRSFEEEEEETTFKYWRGICLDKTEARLVPGSVQFYSTVVYSTVVYICTTMK